MCSNVRIGEKASIKDCEFGTGFEAKPGGALCFFDFGVFADRQYSGTEGGKADCRPGSLRYAITNDAGSTLHCKLPPGQQASVTLARVSRHSSASN